MKKFRFLLIVALVWVIVPSCDPCSQKDWMKALEKVGADNLSLQHSNDSLKNENEILNERLFEMLGRRNTNSHSNLEYSKPRIHQSEDNGYYSKKNKDKEFEELRKEVDEKINSGN